MNTSTLVPIPEVPFPLPGNPVPFGPPSVPEPAAFPLLASLFLVAAAAVWRRRK